MKRKIKQEVSESDSPNEKETSKTKTPKKSKKSTPNSSKLSNKAKSDDSDDDAILREIVSNAVERLRSPNSKTSTSEESRDGVPNENSINKYSTFNAEEITSDDEVYTFYCPDYHNKQDLCNKTVENLESGNQENFHFRVEFLESDKKFLTVAVPTSKKGGCLMNLPYKGHIVLQKSLQVPDNVVRSEDIPKVKFPDNLKVRHPLLGAEWESHLSTAETAISNFKLFHKKNKKQKKEKVGMQSTRKSLGENESVDISVSPSKKRKKS